MELIDKAALVADIERRIKVTESMQPKFDQFWVGQISAFKGVLKILNTIEVKEVDLDNELDFVKDAYYYFTSDERSSMKKVAKHFFELGLKAKDWREERMKECPYRQVGCTMYSGTILECRGACSWVVDYPKLKELEEKKGE